MTEKIVIFGDILSSAEWEKTKLTESLLAKALSFYGKPVLPDIEELSGTAYIDLENESFCSSSFLQKLVSSFDCWSERFHIRETGY